MVEFDVTVSEKDLLDYKFYHKYHNFSGWCEVILGVMLIVLGIYALLHAETMNMTFALLSLLFGVVFLVVIPVQLVFHSKTAASKEGFSKPMHYSLDSENITVSMGDENASVPWSSVYRIKETKKNIFIYFTPTRANIIPKQEVEEQLSDIKAVMIDGAGKYKAALK